jgi:conjugative relaxase-like TrwC/TraI family protein
MRPTAIRGAGAIDYYTPLVPDEADEGQWAAAKQDGEGRVEDYYLPIGEAAGEWSGAGADALDLSGPATRGQMAALLDGRDPRNGERLGQRPRPDGVRAFDLTFSAPKTVSVLLGLLGGEAERAGLTAHDAAVKAALAVLEERATTRGGKNGVQRLDAAGLTVLLVRHRTSRALDPQLHTHALVFAKVQGPDGRWRALDARIVFRAQRTFGAVYQSALRSELTRALGVRWGEVTKGQAEIADLAELVEAFSTRSSQIGGRLEEKLMTWREEHSEREPSQREHAILVRDAARESRPAKDSARMADELRADWLDTAHEHGWDASRVRTEVLAREPVRHLSPATARGDAAAVATAAVNELASRRSVWSIEQLEREIAARIPTNVGSSAKQQARAIEQLAKDTASGLCLDLVDLARAVSPRHRGVLDDPGLERYTTRELLEQEQRITHWFERAARDAGEPASDEQIGRAIARLAARDGSAPVLDPQQAQAAALAAGTNRAVAVVGPAGAGKTTMLQVAVEALGDEGRRVVGLAPTSIAAKRLAEATGLPCENVARYLAEHDRPDGIGAALALRPGDTLIVDEAAMLATADYERLLAIAGTDGLRLVFVGDSRQLAAVGRGGMFDQARQLLPSVELDEIHRFTADWEAAASLALRAGDPAAITAYEAHDRIRYGSAEEMTEAILADWWQAWRASESHAFSAPTNDHIRHLNARAQEVRLDAGELQPGARALRNAHDELITTGDVVATRQNAPHLHLPDGGHVRNRDTWTVTEVKYDGELVLRNRAGACVAVPVAYAKEHVELAYFRTTHGVQGLTERVGGTLVDETAGFRSLYVGMTRGRHTNTAYVITDNDDDGRAVLERALGRDRADLGALAVRDRFAAELERQAERELRASLPDRLAHVRRVLGPDRADALPEHDLPRPDLEALTDQQLHARLQELAGAIGRFHTIDAVEVRRLAEQRVHLEDSIAAARHRAQRIQAQLATARRRDHPALRDELARHHGDESALRERLAELDERELAIAAAGRHPEQWLKHHGRAGGEGTQVAHELDRRHEQAIRAAEQAAIQTPARHIVAAIGERPAAGDPRRDHWDNTAKALERHRLTHNINVDRNGPTGPRPSNGPQRLAWQQLQHDIARARGETRHRDLARALQPELELEIDL